MISAEVAYSVRSTALDQDEDLLIVDFEGAQTLNQLYEYTIRLKSTKPDLDIDALLRHPCSLIIKVGEHETPIHGVFAEFEQLHQIQQSAYTLYQAKLVPRLWRLSLYHVNEIYLDLSIPEIVTQVLEEAGFLTDDFVWRIKGKMKGLEKEPPYRLDDNEYRKWPFRCQYNESHLTFIQRLLEHEGLYFFFEQQGDREILVIADSLTHHHSGPEAFGGEPKPEPDGAEEREELTLVYAPDSGLSLSDDTDKLRNFVGRRKRMPRKVLLQDYDYLKPSLAVEAESEIDPDGQGDIFLYGQYFETPEEGQLLADIRAEEWRSQKHQYYSESSVNRLTVGGEFTLEGHFNPGYNQRYFVTSIEQSGVTPSDQDGDTEQNSYANSFTCIPADVQVRPERIAPKPRIDGTLRAIVDAEGSGEYAEIDAHGRYKVRFPFDRRDKDGGKASYWLRFAQPYGGASEGMHFPLRKGTEVLLTFIDGNPDRPVIQSVVPNASQPSLINENNPTNSKIQSASGNAIEFEDEKESNRIKLTTPQKGTYMHLGAPNHDGDGWVVMTDGIERKEIRGGQQITVTTVPNDASTSRTITKQGDSAKVDSNTGGFFAIPSEIPDAKSIFVLSFDTDMNDDGSSDGSWQYSSNQSSFQVLTCLGEVDVGDRIQFLPSATFPQEKQVSFVYSEIITLTIPAGSRSIGVYDAPDLWGAEGEWQYKTGAGSWTSLGTLSNSSIRVFTSDVKFKYNHAASKTTTGSCTLKYYMDLIKSPGSIGKIDGSFYACSTQSGDSHDSNSRVNSLTMTAPSAVVSLSNPDNNSHSGHAGKEGKWQYQLKNSNSWVDIDDSCISTSSCLFLETGDKLRFKAKASLKSWGVYKTAQWYHYQSNTSLHTESTSTQLAAFRKSEDTVRLNLTETLDIKENDVIDEDDIFEFPKKDFYGNDVGPAKLSYQDEISGNYVVNRYWGDRYTYLRSSDFNFAHGNTRVFNYGNSLTVGHRSEDGDTKGLIDNLSNGYFPSGTQKFADGYPSETWENIIAAAEVDLKDIDVIQAHNGNIYDFGGHWDYNLGNGYEETHMSQTAELNKCGHTMDVVNKGGPDWGGFNDKVDSEIKCLFDKDATWVEKKFGNSYEYTQGNTISVTVGGGHEIGYGGRHCETKFNGEGVKVAESWSAKGQSEEKSYDPTTGSLLSYDFSSHKHFSYGAKIPTYPTLSISTNMSAFLATSIDISLALMTISVSSSNGMSLEVKGSLSGAMEIDLGSWKLEVDTDFSTTFKGPGTQFSKRAELRAQIQALDMNKKILDLKQGDLELDVKSMKTVNSLLSADIAQKFNI